MAITLGALTLPAGLAWSDEFAWSPVSASSSYSLTGALIIERSIKQAGRPITLIGQSSGNDHTAWITRANLLTLKAGLDTGATYILTLHDGRTFTVTARPDDTDDNGSAVDADPLPVVGNFLPANPQSADWYVLRAVRLTTI